SAKGQYLFDSLEPGDYSLKVTRDGFSLLQVDRIHLKARDRQTLRLELTLAVNTTSITVQGVAEGISSDASGGAVLEESFLRHLPVNARNVQSLLQMAPGVVSGAGPGDGINVNGLRSNTNYYMLDGVSLSESGGARPAGGMMGPGGPGAGGPPGGGGGGGASSVSLESLQEVRIQTSAFAPEFGRTPGAQVSMMSRSG